MKTFVLLLITLFLAAACSKPPADGPSPDKVIVGRSVITWSSSSAAAGGQAEGTGISAAGAGRGIAQSQSVQVTNAAQDIFTLSPTLTNLASVSFDGTGESLVYLGNVWIQTLYLNNLNQCGHAHKQHCGHSGVQFYFQDAAGLQNSGDHAQVAPVCAKNSQFEGGFQCYPAEYVGTSTAPYIPATITIPADLFNLSLTNFNDQLGSGVGLRVDFSKAGAGIYTGTLVVELFLAD